MIVKHNYIAVKSRFSTSNTATCNKQIINLIRILFNFLAMSYKIRKKMLRTVSGLITGDRTNRINEFGPSIVKCYFKI